MTFFIRVRALVHQWENGIITAEDFARLVRKAVLEEDKILERINRIVEVLQLDRKE